MNQGHLPLEEESNTDAIADDVDMNEDDLETPAGSDGELKETDGGYEDKLRSELLIARPDLPQERSSDSDSSDESQTVDPGVSTRLVSSIGATSVIDTLEQMCYQNQATPTEVAYLKHRYLKLCSCLSMSRDSEFELLQQAKRFTIELETLHATLAKADTFPDNYNTQADQLRIQVLQAENQRLEREEHCDELSYILEGLQEEKKMLQREYDRMPKEEEMKRARRQLEQTIEELQSENSKKIGETRQLNQTLKDAQDYLEKEMKLKEEANRQLESLTNEFNENKLIPLHHSKESVKIEKKIDEARKIHKEAIEEYEILREELETMDALRIKLDLESAKLAQQSSKKQRRIFDTQTKYDAVNSQLETMLQKTADLTLNNSEMELRMKHLLSERTQLQESLKRYTRERDEAVKMNRKAAQSLQASRDAVKYAKSHCAEKKATCLNLKQLGRDKELIARRKKLLAEVVALQTSVLQQSELSEAERSRVQKCLSEQTMMNLELTDLRIQTVELSRLATIKTDEREQKARDFRTASSRYTRIQDEIKTKKLQIQEYEKSLRETMRRSRDFAALYDAIKEERSSCLSLIQLAQQRMKEIQEKMHICTNEIQVLRETFSQKSEQIARQRTRYKTSVAERDALLRELSTNDCLLRELESRKEQLTMAVDIQNRNIDKSKQAMLELKDTMARVLQLRNDRAVQLIERNEEVCVLQEKLRIQEQVQAKGEVELGTLKEQIRWLSQEKQDLERSIRLCKQRVNHRRELENELTSRQIQLAMCKDHVSRLEKAVADPTGPVIDPETGEPVHLDLVQVKQDNRQTVVTTTSLVKPRINELAGKDQDPAELRLKIDSIQCQLLAKEHKLLEFDMLLKSVTRLVEKLESQAKLDKNFTLQLAKTMNAHQTEVKQTTKKLKANTAEMAMLMAVAFKLEQKTQERRAQLAQCYERMKSGEVPCDEFEKAWQRYQRRQNQKPCPVWEEFIYEDDWTTAPERPNAYLLRSKTPESSHKLAEIIPKKETSQSQLPNLQPTCGPVPYGAHAPFHPAGPSANMRHFRKPKLPDLEM